MTAGRRWTPKACCWKNGCGRSLPPSSGWRKKGGAQAVESPARAAAARAGEGGFVAPRGAGRLQLPQGSSRDPRQRGRPGRQAGAAPVAAPPGQDAPGGQGGAGGRAEEAGGGAGALRQGDEELRAGAVPPLRPRRAARDEQRAGAAVRQPPLPRAEGERAEGGVADGGGARAGAPGGGAGDEEEGAQAGGAGPARSSEV